LQIPDLKQLEKTINKELDALGLLPICIEGINSVSNEPVLTWTTPYDDNVSEYMNEINRTWDVVSTHYENWRRRSVSSAL
jgi:hypothetical protein